MFDTNKCIFVILISRKHFTCVKALRLFCVSLPYLMYLNIKTRQMNLLL